jgi:AcrR family transcriptional regulator
VLTFLSGIGQTGDMAPSKREANRAKVTAELMAAARSQLAQVGAAGLSLREVAREIGMVSSAVYRYVESRDDLLTQLIIEAYDELGAAAEGASATHADRPDLERWTATAHAVRAWAIEHPHRYLLLYGSPVPGYAAPDDTVVPGTRVTFALVGILRDADAGDRLARPASPVAIDDALADEMTTLAGVTGADVDPATIVMFLAAWTQMFGLIGFEITNQTRGIVEDHRALFDSTVRQLGHHVGLR